MSEYKFGNWFCKAGNETEAKEIIERAVASGAVDKFNWDAEVAPFGVFGGVVWWDKVHGTEYTIEQVRQKFLLPGERVEVAQEWNGEYFPPVGVECEFYRTDIERWVGCTTIGMFRDEMVCAPDGGGFFAGKAENFRPIHSERERWVEDAMHRIEKCVKQVTPECAYAAGAIYDAIKSGDLKAPGVSK